MFAALSAVFRSSAEVEELESKKRAKRGCRRERKTTWAPLQMVSVRKKHSLRGWWEHLRSLWQRHPNDQDKLEGVVEGEPVDGVDRGLDNRQEGVDDPVLLRVAISILHPCLYLCCLLSSSLSRETHGQPLGIIGLAAREEGAERVVGRNREAGGVDKELASDVKEDEEEVEGAETQDDVDLRHAGLLLEVVELRVLGELPVAKNRQSLPKAVFGGRAVEWSLLVELAQVVLGLLLNLWCCQSRWLTEEGGGRGPTLPLGLPDDMLAYCVLLRYEADTRVGYLALVSLIVWVMS